MNVPLLNKVYCPREVFPLAAVVVAAVDAVISSFVFVLLCVVTGTAPQAEIVYAPDLPRDPVRVHRRRDRRRVGRARLHPRPAPRAAARPPVRPLRDAGRLQRRVVAKSETGSSSTPRSTRSCRSSTGCARRSSTARRRTGRRCCASASSSRRLPRGRDLALQAPRDGDRRHCVTGRSTPPTSGSASGSTSGRPTSRISSGGSATGSRTVRAWAGAGCCATSSCAPSPGESVGLDRRERRREVDAAEDPDARHVPDRRLDHVAGRVGALIEVRAGISPQLTGRENIYAHRLADGLTRARKSRAASTRSSRSPSSSSAIDRQVKFYSIGHADAARVRRRRVPRAGRAARRRGARRRRRVVPAALPGADAARAQPGHDARLRVARPRRRRGDVRAGHLAPERRRCGASDRCATCSRSTAARSRWTPSCARGPTGSSSVVRAEVGAPGRRDGPYRRTARDRPRARDRPPATAPGSTSASRREPRHRSSS